MSVKESVAERLAELGADWYLHSVGKGQWNICYMPFCRGATSCSRRALIVIGAESIGGCLELAHESKQNMGIWPEVLELHR